MGKVNPDEILPPDILQRAVVGAEFRRPIERRFIQEDAQV
jgi:hypothetical protein